jgi:hypothetical protein
VTHSSTVSPIEAPPKMTPRHMLVVNADMRGIFLEGHEQLTPRDKMELREDVSALVRSLASGQRVVVNPETHATIPKWQIDRVKALIIDRLWPTSPPVNDAVFLELKGMFAAWLSHSSQEQR